ncbi:MAG TPA: hypothetical protein VGJ28_11485, partial [Micromonosporaceae bacterium]
LKPSIDVVISAPLDTLGDIPVAQLVTEGLQMDVRTDERVGHAVTLPTPERELRVAIKRTRTPRP